MNKISAILVPEQFSGRTNGLPRSAGPALGSATFKNFPEDFKVEEVLGFKPSGDGVHRLLKVKKNGWNSADVARHLARLIGCRDMDVGYCGQKDRHAETTQYFSIPATTLCEEALSVADWPNGIELISIDIHHRKLKRGYHRGNRFVIRLRDVDVSADQVDERLDTLRVNGFANYFGSQRFGRDGRNHERGRRWLDSDVTRRVPRSSRTRRSMEISALRSMLFNAVLADRLAGGDWLKARPGDLLILDGSNSLFEAVEPIAPLAERITIGDLHPSGPLWGEPGKLSAAVIERERTILQQFANDLTRFESQRFPMERRPLRAFAEDLQWTWLKQDEIEIAFTLAGGCFATEFLADVFTLSDRSVNRAVD
ncbi:MAG: tRNA pseudouridine synthase D [marine bacterium B5-7]|nr:MAG: tRNA pseudouridine synthase D [marine bacterium B5-7]